VDEPSTTHQRFLVVANPATHGNADRLLNTLKRTAPGWAELEICFTDRDKPLSKIAEFDAENIGAVIAIGGDGTVRAVATALGNHHVPVGIIPGGSTNIIAQELGIPSHPERAAKLIFGDHALHLMDVGVCGDERFMHMAGAGLDSRFFAATDPALKRRIGWRAYIRPLLKQLGEPPVRFTIKADEAVIHVVSPLVLVANGTSILKSFLPIYPDVRSDDGWLDVIIFTPIEPNAVIRTAARFALKRLDRSPYVTRVRAKHVELNSEPRIPVQLDGDVYGVTPLIVDLEPGALPVIVPRDPRINGLSK
jgi:diacylglycerol kinase (ATP)